MEEKNEISIDLCRTLLKRSAWRLQYKVRMLQNKESYSLLDYQGHQDSFDEEVISKIYVTELLSTIPWKKAKIIIEKTIIEEKTEKEVATELKISQQAVSKWKIKGLNVLRQNLNHF